MLALLAAAVACQAPALAPPRPPERIALPGGIAVTAADYLDHLYAAIGSARLRELLLDRVLARAVERIDPATLAPATAQALADPDAHARALRDARIAERHGGSRAAFRAHLAAIGITEDEDLWATRVDGLREARIAALVQAAREPTPARLRRVFEEHYGVDGLRVVVRHVFQSFGAERHRLAQAGGTPDEETVAENVRRRMAALMALHENGTPFHLLVARGSEDPRGRALALDPAHAHRAGEIEGYNFQHFGPEFADAVRAMQPGDVRGPLRTSHGWHIVRLESVTRTEFADVEEKVRELLRNEPPSLAERRELLARLAAEYGVDAALAR